MRTKHGLAGSLLVAAASIAAALDGPQAKLIQLDDTLAEFGLSSLDLSPDGRRLAFVARHASLEENRYLQELFIAGTADGTLLKVGAAGTQVASPQWSRDGSSLAWLDGESERIFLAATANRFEAATALTPDRQKVSALEWSPDGRLIAFLARDSREERAGADRGDDAFEAGESDFLATGPLASSHLWLAPASGGEPRRLTGGQDSIVDLEWLNDARRILLVSQPSARLVDYIDQSLEIIDTGSGTRRRLHSESKALIGQNRPAISPDGRWIAFTRPLGNGRDTDYFPEGISVMPVSGGTPRNVAPTIDRTLVDMGWLRDSRALVLGGPERTRFGLWVQPLTGSPRRIDLGPIAQVRGLVTGTRGQVAFVGSEPNHPPEIFVMDSITAQPRRITSFNARLAALKHGKIETIRWHSDGFEHDGVLYYPPDFDPAQPMPLVLALHGGPSDPISESWHGIHEDAFLRLMAAQGWLVFAPNYRGSGSQGLAYQSAIVNDPSEGPARDVMSGLAAVRARHAIDERRIAISGYSYGGYMTAWLIAHEPGWCAAVAGATVTDHFDWYNLSDYNVTWGLGMNGSPWLDGNWENYWRLSPIAHAHRIRTPTLILAGTDDRRVSITQSYKLYHALRDNGVPVRFIAYPHMGHSPDTPVHERDLNRRWLAWIDEHFRRAVGAQAAPAP